MSQAIKDFFTAWTESDAAKRDAMVAGALADGVTYLDPRTETPLQGPAAIAEYVAQFLPMCPPGASVTVADPVDEKGEHARATVHFIMSEEMRQVGQYFVDLAPDGKITRLVGYAGKGPE